MIFTKLFALCALGAAVLANPLPDADPFALSAIDSSVLVARHIAIRDNATEYKPETAAEETAKDGGLPDDELKQLRDFAAANGLDPDAHISTNDGVLTTTLELAELVKTQSKKRGEIEARWFFHGSLRRHWYVWEMRCPGSRRWHSCHNGGCRCGPHGNVLGCHYNNYWRCSPRGWGHCYCTWRRYSSW